MIHVRGQCLLAHFSEDDAKRYPQIVSGLAEGETTLKCARTHLPKEIIGLSRTWHALPTKRKPDTCTIHHHLTRHRLNSFAKKLHIIPRSFVELNGMQLAKRGNG